MKQLTTMKECLDCDDRCCEYDECYSNFAPKISKEEKDILVKKGIKEPHFREVNGCYQITLEKRGGYLPLRCSLLDQATWKCRIYDDRPLFCKTYPFGVMWNEDRTRLLISFDTMCTKVLKQKDTDEFRQHLQAIKQMLKEKKQYLLDNKEIINPYQDDVEVVGEVE